MERFLQYVLTGLSAGSLYAPVSLGIVLVYSSTRVVNFAHGDVATFGTYVAFALLTAAGASLAVAFAAALALLFAFHRSPARVGAALGRIVGLFSKRLERGRFVWPSTADGVVTISPAQLGYLLEGIDWRAPQKTWRPLSAG